MWFCSATVFTLLLQTLLFANVSSKKFFLRKEANICRRSDPAISECFLGNFRRFLPILNNGIPEMNIAAIDPIVVEAIKMDFTQSKSVKLLANLTDVTVTGISKGDVRKGTAKPSDDGIEIYTEMFIPKIYMTSNYVSKGNFLLLAIDTNGNFTGNFEGLLVKGFWIGTPYEKKGKVHLKFHTKDLDMTIESLQIHFSNVFPGNDQLNKELDKAINENLDALYQDIKPIVLETMNEISLSVINSLYEAFPYDDLWPKE